eukprot:gene5525-biopygen10253
MFPTATHARDRCAPCHASSGHLAGTGQALFVHPPKPPPGRNGTGRVRFFKFYRVGRVRDASVARPQPFLPAG